MKIRAIVGVLCLCSFSIFSGPGNAESPPSDNELKAAYCLKIIQRRVVWTEEFIGAGDRFKALYDKRLLDQQRLRGYLLPRLHTLDANALLFAAQRAEDDFESYKKIPSCQTLAQMRSKSLEQLNKQEIEIFQRCQETFRNSAAAKRINSCDDLTWLPF